MVLGRWEEENGAIGRLGDLQDDVRPVAQGEISSLEK